MSTPHKWAKEICAWAVGKVVQVHTHSGWVDLPSTETGGATYIPTFDPSKEHRIKPEEVVDYTIVSDKGTVAALFFSNKLVAFDHYGEWDKKTFQGYCKRTRVDGKVVSLEFIPR